jgi:predicted Zn-dependent protease
MARSPRRRRAASLGAALGLALVGCGTLSVQEEQQLGAEMARDARHQLDFLREEVVVHYVEQMGQGLVKASGPQPFRFHFYVVEEPEINAFAAPAGYVYVNTGTILAAANASELAGVIAHEVGHVALRHIAKNYNKQQGAGVLYKLFAVAASIFVPGPVAAASQLGGQLAVMGVLNSFSREAEAEADAFAVRVMPQAGWDPQGLVTFFQTLQQQSHGGRPPEFLSSHPATESRIQATAKLIREQKLPEGLRESDAGKLQIIQRRIQILTGHAAR